MAKARRQKTRRKTQVFQIPKKGSKERIAMQRAKIEQKKQIEKAALDDRATPPFLSAILIGCGIPQTFSIYSMIWNDLLSDNTFLIFDVTYSWIAILVAMEGGAA